MLHLLNSVKLCDFACLRHIIGLEKSSIAEQRKDRQGWQAERINGWYLGKETEEPEKGMGESLELHNQPHCKK